MTIQRVLLLALALSIFPLHGIAQSQTDFFDSNTLQEIRLEIRPNDWSLLKQNYLENTYYACDFHWIFKGKDITLPDIGIRSRGLGSRSGVKPSLRVDFNRYESQQTFLGLKSIALRANTQDASMMHERVSMEFFRKMGLKVSRETHTKLYVNDEYVGLYTIVESLDKAFLKANFGEDGGYLYSYQYNDPWFFEDRGSNPATYSPVPFSPEFDNQVPNPAPFVGMVQAINQSSDAQFQAMVSQYIDWDKLLTELAVENFLSEQDGILGDYGLNNFYLYRFKGKNLHAFIPWDKSNTFWSLDWPITRNIQTNVLSRRAFATPELRAAYLSDISRAAEIAGGPGGWLEQEINREYRQIQQAAYADPVKLCDPGATGGLRPCTNEQFDAEVARMLEFARQRATDVQAQLGVGTNQQSFSITNLGGFSITAAGAATGLKAGYARIQGDPGNTTPSGLAIFSVRNRDIVISEAGVPASPLIQAGRIYAEVRGAVNTGLAIANPNDQLATISFYFTDTTGRNFGQGTTTIAANGQIAQFLDAPPFNSGTLAGATFTFTSSVPVAAIALRGFTNERSEFLITTQPVAAVTARSGNLLFPHFADGGGWSTQIVLMNPTDAALSGTVQFLSQSGQTILMATADGQAASSFIYAIAPRSMFRLRTSGSSSAVQAGSVRVTPAPNSGAPVGVGTFSFRNGGVTVTEAGVPAVRAASAFRIYAEVSGDFAQSQIGSIGTGIAVTNSTASTANVTFELTKLDGTSAGLTGSASVPANGQTSLFLNQLPGFSALSTPFQGILRVSGPAGIAVVGLRGRYNERNDFIITTISPVAEDEPPSQAEMFFPHIVEGGGYTTQFILFSGQGQASGILRFFGQSGEPLALAIH